MPTWAARWATGRSARTIAVRYDTTDAAANCVSARTGLAKCPTGPMPTSGKEDWHALALLCDNAAFTGAARLEARIAAGNYALRRVTQATWFTTARKIHLPPAAVGRAPLCPADKAREISLPGALWHISRW